MAYSSGKTKLSKRDKKVRDALKKRAIIDLLWLIVEESFMDQEADNELRHGQKMFHFALQEISRLTASGKLAPDTKADKAAHDMLADWLSE